MSKIILKTLPFIVCVFGGIIISVFGKMFFSSIKKNRELKRQNEDLEKHIDKIINKMQKADELNEKVSTGNRVRDFTNMLGVLQKFRQK